jgi:DNA-binding transcriptional LysR family regulator
LDADDENHHRWDFAPEIIIPVCSPSYLAAHGRLDHDSDGAGHVFLQLSNARRRWPDVWGRVADPRTSHGTWHEFSDYAVVLQAAMNGEGIALGWLVNVARALVKGILVPASERQTATGRTHSLIAPRARPVQPVVASIRDWMITEMQVELQEVRPFVRSDVWR